MLKPLLPVLPLLAVSLLAAPGASGAPQAAGEADRFVDTVGVNVHLHYTDTVDFTLSGGNARSVLMQKRNGEFWLAVWLPNSLWDNSRPYGQNQEHEPVGRPCTVTFAEAPAGITIHSGLSAEKPGVRELAGAASFQLAVSEEVQLIRVVPAEQPAPGPSLVSNGGFEVAADGGGPADWGFGAGTSWETEGGNRFMRLNSTAPGANVMVYRAVTMPPGAGALELSYKVRHQGIERGRESWFDGRIMMNFKDPGKAVVKPGPGHPNFTGTSDGWVARSQQFRVPAGAAVLELMFTLFQAKAGRLDFDDIALRPIPLAVIEAAEQAAKAKEAARIAALPKPKPQVAVPPPDKLPPQLRVEGNRLLTAAGEPVWLQGLAIPSMEWSAGGENILRSIGVAIDDWQANCIRLPVREHFWAGSGPHQSDGGMLYRQTVEDAVNLCAGKGAYLVIDLHAFRAPQKQHAAFWKDVAARFANHPAVLFDLLNEPHDISWKVWRDGGRVGDGKRDSDAAAERADKLAGFDAVGMQELLEIVRATGANNVLIAGGLDWGYDLSGVLDGFALKDPGGNGIVYSSHVYPWKRGWQDKFVAVAARHPVFLGEVGADTRRMEFIPESAQEDPATWVPDMLATIQQHQLHWTAWSFHPGATPRVISDWNYTPTPFWGQPAREALGGRRFELKRMR